MGKGSGRRPQQISDSEMQDRWNVAFKPKDELAGNGTTYEEASNVNDEMKLHQEKMGEK